MAGDTDRQKSLILWAIWMTALAVILLWAAYLVRNVLLLLDRYAGADAASLAAAWNGWRAAYVTSGGAAGTGVATEFLETAKLDVGDPARARPTATTA